MDTSFRSQSDTRDNVLTETINGLYKAEVIRRRTPWKSPQQLQLATLA